MSNRKSATASKSRPSNTKRAAASKRGRRPKAAARAQRKKQAVVRSRKENHLRLVSGEATEAPIEVHNETKPDASEAENRTTRAAELDASLQPSLQKDSGAGENSRRETFDFTLPFATMLAYQAKLLEVAQENMQFGLEFHPEACDRQIAFRAWVPCWRVYTQADRHDRETFAGIGRIFALAHWPSRTPHGLIHLGAQIANLLPNSGRLEERSSFCGVTEGAAF